MSNRLRILVVLLLALSVPGAASATLMDFGAAGIGTDLSAVNSIPASSDTTLDLFFSTTGTDDPLGLCVAGPGCIFGWTGTLVTIGTLQITGYDPSGNANTATGAGSTSCDGSFLPASSCQTNGGDAANGEVGLGIVMFSLTVSGGAPGDQLLYTGDFTLSDFSSAAIQNQVLATVVPEPGTFTLLGGGVALLAISRRRTR